MGVSEDIRLLFVSDTHITDYRDLLKDTIAKINEEPSGLVVFLGDLVNNPKFFNLLSNDLKVLNKEYIAVPGDYDFCKEWIAAFGNRFRKLETDNYKILFLDTSFMGHKYASGWLSNLEKDSEQFDWYNRELSTNKFIVVASHHPAAAKKDEVFSNRALLPDNVRACVSGHIRVPYEIYFPYINKVTYESGFMTNFLTWHGSSAYVISSLVNDGRILSFQRVVTPKVTAW